MILKSLKNIFICGLGSFFSRFPLDNEYKYIAPLQFMSLPIRNSRSHREASAHLGNVLARRQLGSLSSCVCRKQ